MTILITPNADEFCEQYCMECCQEDELVDTDKGCEWHSSSGALKGLFAGGTVREVSTWIYLNLK